MVCVLWMRRLRMGERVRMAHPNCGQRKGANGALSLTSDKAGLQRGNVGGLQAFLAALDFK